MTQTDVHDLLTWISENYDNQDMNHVDYRVKAAEKARAILETKMAAADNICLHEEHQLAEMARTEQERLVEAVTRFMPTNINLDNANVSDKAVVPLDVTVGELRAISKALSAIKGDKS